MRRALVMVLALAAVACSGDGDDTTADTTADTAAPASEPSADSTVASEPAADDTSEPDGAVADAFDLSIVFPAPPADLDVADPVGVPGEPLDPARLDTDQRWLWCDEAEGLPVARLAVGDVWLAGEGVGISVQVNVLSFAAGAEVPLPSVFGELTFFVVDTTEDPLVPSEYSSNEEESSGAVTFEAMPCRGEGDVLALTVDGALGAETDPGYRAAAQVSGTMRMTVTGPPAG